MRPPPLRTRLFLLSALSLALVAAAGCSNRLDQAAKSRIFSPEEPAADVRRASEEVDIPAQGRIAWHVDAGYKATVRFRNVRINVLNGSGSGSNVK